MGSSVRTCVADHKNNNRGNCKARMISLLTGPPTGQMDKDGKESERGDVRGLWRDKQTADGRRAFPVRVLVLSLALSFFLTLLSLSLPVFSFLTLLHSSLYPFLPSSVSCSTLDLPPSSSPQPLYRPGTGLCCSVNEPCRSPTPNPTSVSIAMLTSVQGSRQTRHPPLHPRQGTFRSTDTLIVTHHLGSAEELEIDLPTQSSRLLDNTTDTCRIT